MTERGAHRREPMSTPVTQADLDSVNDLPVEVALNYLEGLERERRGLLKVGAILRALQQAGARQASAERQLAELTQQATTAQAALEALQTRIATEQARLNSLT